MIANGILKGRSLAEVMPSFPLLTKVIDAKSRLSVQVHPNETTSRVTGGEPKTEMWVMLEDGVIFAGLKPGVSATEVADAVKSGAFEDLLVRHEGRKGECFFIPGGLVHAIGDDTLVYEVQQSSDTTFRLYDWGRVGTDGKPRELHIDRGCRAIDYALPAPQPLDEVECDFFRFRKLKLSPQNGWRISDAPAVVFNPVTRQSTLVPPGVAFPVDEPMELYVTTCPK